MSQGLPPAAMPVGMPASLPAPKSVTMAPNMGPTCSRARNHAVSSMVSDSSTKQVATRGNQRTMGGKGGRGGFSAPRTCSSGA